MDNLIEHLVKAVLVIGFVDRHFFCTSLSFVTLLYHIPGHLSIVLGKFNCKQIMNILNKKFTNCLQFQNTASQRSLTGGGNKKREAARR
jgi:hypothetical protein